MSTRSVRVVLVRSCCCALLLGLTVLAAPGGAQQVLELRPNLVAVPASNLAVVTDVFGRPRIRFDTLTWNAGAGALILVAGETGSGRQNIYQRVELSDGSSYDRLAGTFVWHPTHNHFHLENYAVYTLQAADARGRSGRTSSKTSFCIMDTTRIDGKLPGAPKRPVFEDCGDVIQGMSVGWGDLYGSHLPGQEIDLSDLADGDYELTIEVDPRGQLIESDESDNSACILIRIGIASETVSVLDETGCDGSPAPPPEEEIVVDAISPDSALPGSLTAVTITGSGFVPGLAVSFENGSGPKPSASEVSFVDSNTLTALVTVKRGGGTQDPVWDLRVGGRVLADAFTVLR